MRVIGYYNLDMLARKSSTLYHYILLNDGMDWTPTVKINSEHTLGKLKLTKYNADYSKFVGTQQSTNSILIRFFTACAPLTGTKSHALSSKISFLFPRQFLGNQYFIIESLTK